MAFFFVAIIGGCSSILYLNLYHQLFDYFVGIFFGVVLLIIFGAVLTIFGAILKPCH